MNIIHHPDDATLMAYAAGSLPEALSAVVYAHSRVCARCRSALADMELLGGVLVEDLDGVGLERSASSALGAPGASGGNVARAEHPLADYLSGDLDELPWRRLGLGVWHVPLSLSQDASGDLRLLKVAPGQVMPEHGHGGSELTLLLAGSYRDEIGEFRAGDVADLDDEVEHTPVADPKSGCICLIASEQRARFKGVLARIVQPLTGL